VSGGLINPDLRVVVIDDDPIFVDTLVEQFGQCNVEALGVKNPVDLLRSTKQAPYEKYDMIFLDMRLGKSGSGQPIMAADILLHLMTYASESKVVVFSQDDISAAECVRCIRLGALGIIPKLSDVGHYVLIGKAYRDIGDEVKARQERIVSLWGELHQPTVTTKGQYLEMLLVNLFNSINGMKVVHYNKKMTAGEIDILVENTGTHQFWKMLDSLFLVVECKNRDSRSQTSDYNVLDGKVRGKHDCNVGIMVAWNGVTSGFKQLQQAKPAANKERIYVLNKDNLFELVSRSPENREAYLREIFSGQL
jgi:ActR/RegA family two-component response regulator/Holliday junction resolvase-like predicted endonuclease